MLQKVKKKFVDFFYSLSPLITVTSIRLLIAVVAIYDLKFHQIDVKTAFFSDDLDEEII